MGCFDYTCAISELPIKAGTPCRLLALTPSRLGLVGGACSVHQVLFPALEGSYDEYGYLEDFRPTALHERIAEQLGHSTARELADSVKERGLWGSTKDGEQPLGVGFSLVRNDVWEAMLSMESEAPHTASSLSDTLTLACKEGAALFSRASALLQDANGAGGIINVLMAAGRFAASDSSRVAKTLWRYGLSDLHNEYPTFFRALALHLDGPYRCYTAIEPTTFLVEWSLAGASEAVLLEALQLMAEQITVDRNMGLLRKVWMCRDSSGPQHGDTYAHLRWAQKMVDLARSDTPC